MRVFLAVEAEEGMAESICKTLRRFKEVKEAYLVSEGVYDVLAMIEVYTLDRYRIFAVDELGPIKGIIDYISFLVVGPGEEEY